MLATPPSGRIKVARMRTMVVLPAPFGPSKAKTDPVGMVRSTSSSTRLGPKDFVIPEAITVYFIRRMVYEAHSYSQGVISTPEQVPENQRPPTLPPGLDLLWGRREPGRRGPKPGLTLDGIVAAAVRLRRRRGP